MPRVGGEFVAPYPPVVPDTTIESEVHNGIVADFVADANSPRPIVAGGTGAYSPAEARTNLQVEVREVAVTNYDSHVFEAGSFYSAAGATGTPAGACTGICTHNVTSDDLFLQATDQTSGVVYTRRRTGGVWSVWTATTAGLATIDYVNSVVSNTSLQALACNGMQINGSMEVAQEKAVGFGTTATDAYICDGWQVQKSGTIDVTWYHGLNTSSFPGFSSNISSILGTAKPSLSAGDTVGIYQNIEGYRISKLAWGTASASPITLGFWVLHTTAGTYTGAVNNNSTTRSYAFSYTQNVANALEYKTIVIPGCPDGVWEKGNLVGMTIVFAKACGTTYTAPSLNTWLTGYYVAGPGQINAIAVDARAFRITGVTIFPGTQALTAAESSLLMRPFDQELVTCQRYYQRIDTVQMGVADGNTAPVIFLPTTMRATPTIINNGAATWTAHGTESIKQSTATGGFMLITLLLDARL